MNHELCIDDNVKEFIKKHLKDDVKRLALAKFPDGIGREFVIRQIYARQVLSKKLPSWADNDELIFPKKLSLEQCSSELTAKYKATLLSAKLHETTRKEISEDLCHLVEETVSAKLHETVRKEISEDSCHLVEEAVSAKLHETTLKEISEDLCHLVEEAVSAKLHETVRKEISEDSCHLVEETVSAKLHETTRKEISED